MRFCEITDTQHLNPTKLTFRYAFVHAAYWSAQCGTYSFANTLLTYKGFTESQIGIAMALGSILGVIGQPILAGIADSSKKISLQHLILMLTALTITSFGALWFVPNIFGAVLALCCATMMLMQIIQPLINSLSVYYVNRGVPVVFGVARAVGSGTFAVVSVLLGRMVDSWGKIWIMLIGVLFLILLAVMVFSLPIITTPVKNDAQKEADKERFSIGQFLRKYPRFCFVLVGITLLFTFHYMCNTYLLQILKPLNGGDSELGIALAIAAVFELPTMIFFGKLQKKCKSTTWMIVSAVMFLIKSILFLVAWNVPSLYVAHIFQMGSYALYIPASIYYVNEVMEDRDKFKGQAIMTGTNTLGSLIGSLLGGFLIEKINVQAMNIAGVIFSALGTAVVILSFTVKKRGK